MVTQVDTLYSRMVKEGKKPRYLYYSKRQEDVPEIKNMVLDAAKKYHLALRAIPWIIEGSFFLIPEEEKEQA